MARLNARGTFQDAPRARRHTGDSHQPAGGRIGITVGLRIGYFADAVPLISSRDMRAEIDLTGDLRLPSLKPSSAG